MVKNGWELFKRNHIVLIYNNLYIHKKIEDEIYYLNDYKILRKYDKMRMNKIKNNYI